jgi:hypothetical protein
MQKHASSTVVVNIPHISGMAVGQSEAAELSSIGQIGASNGLRSTRTPTDDKGGVWPIYALDPYGFGDDDSVGQAIARRDRATRIIDAVGHQHHFAIDGHIHGGLDICRRRGPTGKG